MAKEKNSSDTPAPKPAKRPVQKKAAKKSPANKVVAKKTAAEPLAAAAAAVSSQLSTPAVHTAQPSDAQLYDEIRNRAYELYRQRGAQHGLHEADWHRAESEVRSKKG